jgi:hypothetical protein
MSTSGNGRTGVVAPPANDYHYDVFLSYSYKPDQKNWVGRKFYPNFIDPLDSALIQLGLYPGPWGGRVYVAEREMRPGDYWPLQLQEKLQRSKVLVAICSPHYFVSGWCKSEWQTFRSRAPNLIVPVLYDGSNNYLDPYIQPIQADDFRTFIEIPGGAMARFRTRLRSLAAAVAAKVADAPPYGGTFPPIIVPPSTPNATFMSL